MQNERSTSQHGAAVVRYDGKRGTVWRIKYRDANGVQVQETIGAERDGVTEKKAKAELRERLARVERKGYRRPRRLSFADYAEIWFEEGKRRRSWKPATLVAYRTVLDHLATCSTTCSRRRRPRSSSTRTRSRAPSGRRCVRRVGGSSSPWRSGAY